MTTTAEKTNRYIPYGRQSITDQDIEAVNEVLRSDWLTCGPAGQEFEKRLAQTVNADQAIACSNGTAALHLAMLALGIKAGDIVITSPISFLASANCARYVGAQVWFADIDPNTGLINPDAIERLLKHKDSHKVKAVIPVHLAGQPCDMKQIQELCRDRGIAVVEDACHALGGAYDRSDESATVGSCQYSDLTVFSFHPVKHVAMGEGGALTTNNRDLADRLRRFRNHGMEKRSFTDADLAFDSKGRPNPWYYEMTDLGYNYRLSDIQAALGTSQLARLGSSIARRQELARLYDRLIEERFDPVAVRPLWQQPNRLNAYHLYVVRIDFKQIGIERAQVMNRLSEAGIGTQVHYIPIFLQPIYREQSLEAIRTCPHSQAYYESALSLPLFPDLTDEDVERVVNTLGGILEEVAL